LPSACPVKPQASKPWIIVMMTATIGQLAKASHLARILPAITMAAK